AADMFSNVDMVSFSMTIPSCPSPVMARENMPRTALCWYACFVEANTALRHSGGVKVNPSVPIRAAVSSTLARCGALTACLTSSMLSSSFGSWAAVTSGCSGTELTELVAAGGEGATVDDLPGRIPTTVQITSTATA